MSATAVPGPVRGFRHLWAATATSSLGDGTYLAAAPLLAAALTSNPVAVSLVSTATLAPWFFVGPFAGALVDRWPRRTVMIVADLIRAACLVVLALLAVIGASSVVAIAVTGFVLTSGQSFHSAAAQAMIPNLIGRDRTALAAANSRIATTESVTAGFVGPPIGGALFALAPWVPIAVDAASFGSSAALLRGVPPPPRPERTGLGIFASLKQAIRFMVRHRQILELALLIAGGNLATNAAMATFVLYAHRDLGVTSWGYGFLLVAQALGATVAGWIATLMSRHLRFRTMLVWAQLARAVAFLALATTSSPYLAGVCMAMIGGSFTIGTVAAVSTRQQLVPDHMLGSVVNVFRLIGNGAAPIGAAVGGIIAARYALGTPIIVGGVLTLTVAGLSLLPKFRPSSADAEPEQAAQR